jgi:hypothetical protein
VHHQSNNTILAMMYHLEKAREIDGFFVERYNICIRAIAW